MDMAPQSSLVKVRAIQSEVIRVQEQVTGIATQTKRHVAITGQDYIARIASDKSSTGAEILLDGFV